MRAITVTLLLDVDSDAEAFDAVNEILREQQRSFVESSSLIDYAIDKNPIDAGPLPADYVEGDYFGTANSGVSHGVYAPLERDPYVAQEPTGARTAYSAMKDRPSWEIDYSEEDQPKAVSDRLSTIQKDALRKLARLGHASAKEIGVSGATLNSLNDFERGKRGILPPITMVGWDRAEPSGNRIWHVTRYGLAVIEFLGN